MTRTLLLRLTPEQFDTLTRLAFEGRTTKTALIREWIAKAESRSSRSKPAGDMRAFEAFLAATQPVEAPR